MKKLLSLIVFALFSLMASAQVSQTVNVTTPGTLATLASAYLSTVTNLTVTGNIDARDVKTMRDNMPVLAVLDIGAVSIKEYTGGATSTYTNSYAANEMPQFSFCNSTSFTGKITLKTIVLPTSIKSIGDFAFRGCTVLTGCLNLPDSLTSIGNSAFNLCKGLTGSLTIPNLVTTIGSSAFENCSGYTDSLILGNGLTSIADWAFGYCSGFKTINSLSATPPTIGGANAFYNIIPSLVYVPANAVAAYKVASIWSSFTIATEKRVTINVSTAGGMAASIVGGGFGPLNSITHLTITGNINSIDIGQMKTNMTALTAIDLSGTSITSNALPAIAFQSRTSLTSVILPSNMLSIGNNAFDGCINLSGDIPLPASVTSLGTYAFQNCKSLIGTLTIPTGVTVINTYAFSGCSGISGGLILPNTITSIGSYAFNGCKSLTGSLTIPSNVTVINSYIFAGCSGLSGNITFPNSFTTVSASAFSGCSQLSGKVELPLSATSIGVSAFQGCAKITELSLGKNLTSIGDNALNGCTSLAKISVARTTPPTVYANTFTGIPVENCFINVPTNSMNSYQTTNYWSAFILYIESLPSVSYNITLSIGTGGVVKENNVTLVNGSVLTASVGSTKTFTFTPNAGYAVATLTYGGVDVKSALINNQYNTAAINANTTLNVTFSKVQFSLSIKDASTGSVNLLCEYGAIYNFNFTPTANWKVSTVFYNNIDVTSALINGVYTVPAITDNSLLNVAFVSTVSGAQQLINNNLKVYTTQSDIIVEGSIDGENIILFTVNGKQLQTVKSVGERLVISAQRDAVYLVKTASKTFKVIL